MLIIVNTKLVTRREFLHAMATDASTATSTAATSTVAAVNVKLPPYWPADPQVWFAQVEAQFTTRGITSQKTKFDYIVASLSSEIATEVRDLILTPPAENPFDTLKEQLIKRTTASEQKRLQQLLNAEDLGDRKPSQVLRRMQQLLGDKATSIDRSFLRELFLQRLPANIRMVLASTPDTSTLEEVAQLADKIVEVAAPTTVAAMHSNAEVEQLRTEVSRLTDMVKSLTKSKTSRGRSPSPHPQSSSTLCWYHERFGDNARKCRPPCSKSGNDPASR